MANPASGIGHVQNVTTPACIGRSSIDVFSDRPHQRYDHLGLQAFNSSTQQRFALEAGSAPGLRIGLIHRVPAQVDQITTAILECVEELFVPNRRIDRLENLSNSPIQTGITAIEEPARCRWGFADEQNTQLLRTKPPS